MEYRSLGRTGAQVSPLCLGCMNFGWGADEGDSIKIIDRAIDAGINFLDTADVYGQGASETIVGKALREKRDAVFLATKVHGKMGDRPNDQGNSRLHIMRGCEDSLRRLGTDHIDLYQIHRPQGSVPIDETLRALDDLIRQGKVRYIGTSTYGAWQLVESLWQSEKLGLNRFVCEQPPYNLLDRRIERELLPFAQTYGFGVIPWSPLAGGMLSGKYKRGKKGPAGSRYESGKFRSGEPVPKAAWAVIEGAEKMAQEKDCTVDAFALAWTLAHPAITSPIIGPRTMEQLEANLKAVEVEVTEEDRKRVDELIEPGTHAATYYQADFGPHPFR
ncbi:MAG TPA: aldo/keto reductase [Abditibacteriaceae bacterium]|nr:aldo/keto reductase [Abditibacteriaceae bacterium]